VGWVEVVMTGAGVVGVLYGGANFALRKSKKLATLVTKTGLNRLELDDLDKESAVGSVVHQSEETVKCVKTIMTNQKRAELVTLIHDYPTYVDQIIKVYDEYRDMGGNSYVSGLYDDWYKDHAVPHFKKRKGASA